METREVTLPGLESMDLDAIIHLKNSPSLFRVSSACIALYSKSFARFWRACCHFMNEEFVIESKVAERSVCEFLKACPRQEYGMKAENIYDFMSLCCELEVSSILTKVKEFLKSEPASLKVLVSGLKCSLSHDLATIEYGSFLGSHFADLIADSDSSSSILDLPLDILIRIIENGIKSLGIELDFPDSVFKFLLAFAQRFGSSASIISVFWHGVLESIATSRALINSIAQLRIHELLARAFPFQICGPLRVAVACDRRSAPPD
jgi:hypothetical protein